MKLSLLYESPNQESEKPAPGERTKERFNNLKGCGDLDKQTPEDVLLQKEFQAGSLPDTASPSDIRGYGRQL